LLFFSAPARRGSLGSFYGRVFFPLLFLLLGCDTFTRPRGSGRGKALDARVLNLFFDDRFFTLRWGPTLFFFFFFPPPGSIPSAFRCVPFLFWFFFFPALATFCSLLLAFVQFFCSGPFLSLRGGALCAESIVWFRLLSFPPARRGAFIRTPLLPRSFELPFP